jgi:two-component system, NarL family, invasion response regulator UvrY
MEASRRTSPESEQITVITVDDHAVFRRAARDVVAATPGFETIGEAESGEEALRLVAEVSPALVLLDVRMPGMDGVEAAQHIARGRPEAVIVLITIDDPEELPSEAASCGAVAVARKQDFGPRMLERLWEAHGHASSSGPLARVPPQPS